MKQMPKPKGRVKPIFLAAVSIFVVAGCSLPAAERHAPPHTYILSVHPLPAISSVSSNPGRKGTLLINPARAKAGFDTPRMVYLLRPHEVSYYADNQWVDTPARMLAPLLARAMEQTGLWQAVVQMPSAVRADYQLDAEDLSFEQQFFSRPSRVRLTLSLQLVELKGRSVVGGREFAIVEEAPSDDAYGGTIAANRAVEKMLEQVIDWLSAIMNEQRRRRG